MTHLGEILVAGLGLDVADEVAVVAVVGGVQQPQVVAALLAVELDTVKKSFLFRISNFGKILDKFLKYCLAKFSHKITQNIS